VVVGGHNPLTTRIMTRVIETRQRIFRRDISVLCARSSQAFRAKPERMRLRVVHAQEVAQLLDAA